MKTEKIGNVWEIVLNQEADWINRLTLKYDAKDFTKKQALAHAMTYEVEK